MYLTASSNIPNDLAFVVIGSSNKALFWLQWNKHLDGYNFFGGHIEEGESPITAAARELLEEVGPDMNSTWGIAQEATLSLVTTEEDIEKCLEALGPIDGVPIKFFSKRRQRDHQANCFFFFLDVARIAGFENRLDSLQTVSSIGGEEGERGGPSVIASFSVDQLLVEAWSNPTNPFIRQVFEQGVIAERGTSHAPYEVDPCNLSRVMEEIHRNWLTEHDQIHITVTPPVFANPGKAPYHSRGLMMQICASLKGQKEVFKAAFPFPVEGVFCLEGADQENPFKPSLNIWHPSLVEREGYWAIRTIRKGEPHYELRIATPVHGVMSIVIPESGREDALIKLRKALGKAEGVATRSVETPLIVGNLPDEIANLLPEPRTRWTIPARVKGLRMLQSVSRNLDTPTDCTQRIAGCLIAMLEAPGQIKWLDEADLAYKRLQTYSAHLLQQYTGTLESVVSKANRKGPGDSAAKLWKDFCSHSDHFQARAFDAASLRRAGRLQAFRPTNAADAISRLTSFSKYPYPGEALDRLPANYRQMHPSYRGLVCPFESPESKRVGLTLHLAAGVRTTPDGSLIGASYHHPSRLPVGFAASLVPFLRHNDAPRAMMGAKNLKQAVRIPSPDTPRLTTGNEALIAEVAMPLMDLGLLGEETLPACGKNLLVAYMPFDGWNFEDGIVANAEFRDSGAMDWIEEESGVAFVLPGWQLCQPVYLPDAAQPPSVDFQDGLRRIGSLLSPASGGIPLAFFIDESGNVQTVAGQISRIAELQSIQYEPPRFEGAGGRLSWTVRYYRALSIGDKLMARHGNKGVISRFVTASDMPRLPDDPRLPDALRGRAVDLVLNPNGVISRMNIGQLIEVQTTLGLALMGHSGAYQVGQVLHDNYSDLAALCQEAFNNNGACDEFGRIHLSLGFSGQTTVLPIVVGFEYFYRLKQSPYDKANARGTPSSPIAYARLTGQPVAGRRFNGGQRLGEMEMFALLAHRSRRFLQSALGERSARNGKAGNPTVAAISAHLALEGMKLAFESGHAMLSEHLIPESIASSQLISNPKPFELQSSGNLVCSKSGCSFRQNAISHLVALERSANNRKATFGSLLRHLELTITDEDWAGVEALSESRFASCNFSFKCHDPVGKLVDLSLRLERKGSMILSGFVSVAAFEFALKARIEKNEEQKLDRSKIMSMDLCCPEHSGKRLITENIQLMVQPSQNGLFDNQLFGENETSIAYMRVGTEACDTSEYLPVMPLRYRHLPRIGARQALTLDPIDVAYTALLDGAANDREQFSIWKAFLQKQFDVRLFGKFGLLRRHGLGRRVNRSGRFVIVPDPGLAWDECGLSAPTLAILLGADLQAWQQTWSASDQSLFSREWTRVQALHAPFPSSSSALFMINEVNYISLATIVDGYIKASPHVRVVLNRAPSLHMYSILAFKPTVLPFADGQVLRINPLVCKPFGADFDGDEMSVHLPCSVDEHIEVGKLMSPTAIRNLISLADQKPLAAFSQDFVLGLYLAGQTEEGRKSILSILADACCTQQLASQDVWPKSVGGALIEHVCVAHPDAAAHVIPALMRECFRAATLHGTSFGYFDLLRTSSQLGVFPSGTHDNAALELLAKTTIKAMAESDDMTPGKGLGELSFSGARGDEKQTRQILIARGELDPGELNFPVSNAPTFFIQSSLLSGMTATEAFFAAFNGRSSMVDKKLSTPRAGAIFRSLCLTAGSWRVVTGDCGSSSVQKSALECLWHNQKRICAACYGDVLYGTPENEYPAGIIAAQSFGERGTQLSMQSFHTGQKAVSPEDLSRLLRAPAFFVSGAYPAFKQAVDAFAVYNSIDERHIQVLWLALTHQMEELARGTVPLDQALFGAGQKTQLRDLAHYGVSQQIEASPFLDLLFGGGPAPVSNA